MKQMNIALLTKDSSINGGNRVVANFAEAFNAHGHYGIIFTNYADANFEWAGYTGKTASFETSTRSRFDLAISFYFSEHQNLKAINATRKIKYIQANYDKDGEEESHRKEISKKYLLDKIAENVVVSKYLQMKLLNKGIESRIVRPTIDKKLFFYDDDLIDGNFRILIEGGLSRWKRVPEAYSAIPDGYEIWGLGPEDHNDKAKRMWINPEQNELRKIYSACGLLIKLAIMEGHPLTILEAMSCGLIPIVSNEGGHLDYCRDEVNSFIAQNGDHVAVLIKKIINMEREQSDWMKNNAISTAYEREWVDVVKEILA